MSTRFLSIVSLVAVFGIGALLRSYNLSWDGGHLYHPDEMNIAFAMANIRLFDHLDPGFYAYNGFSLYLYKFIVTGIAWMTGDLSWTTDLGRMVLAGRHVSAVVSTLSLGLIYILGSRLAGTRVAFLATALSAFNVGLFQCAHFAVTESLLVFFLLLTALCTSLYIDRGGYRGLLLSLVLGVAIGTKTSALSFLIFPLFVILYKIKAWGDFPIHGSSEKTCRDWRIVLKHIPFAILKVVLGAFFLAGIAFAVSPYSILNLDAFRSSMAYEGGVVQGSVRVPYTLQFCDTVPYIPCLQGLFWLCTPPVALLGIIGLVVWLFSSVKAWLFNRTAPSLASSPAVIPFLLFGLGYGAYIGLWYAKFVRYLIPLIPVISLCSAWTVETVRRRFPRLATILVILLLGGSGIWSACFFSIYARPSSRTAASAWLYDAIPSGTNLLVEHYDYQLPVPLSGKSPWKYPTRAFPFYAPDTPEKMRDLAQALATADLVILASRRLYTTIPKAPKQYPLTSRYYADLLAGNLGFHQIAEFSSPPGIGPWTISDDSAEETFQVFDHPTIRIFQKQRTGIPLPGTYPVGISPVGTSPAALEAFLRRPISP
ncbi:MAG: glycosyltransferase family 39 protein [Candidatus Ozemobacteraceae bacterium]